MAVFLSGALLSVSAASNDSQKITDSKKGEGGTGQVKGPIVITSETLLTDNAKHTALFEGSSAKQVVAKSENMVLYSDKMMVHYTEQSGNVTRIDAEGNIKFVKENLVVTSNEAVYFAAEDKVVFTGEPKAVERGNVVTGTKLIYLLKEDRSIVENPRILLENKKGK